jgi:hypothetical protein
MIIQYLIATLLLIMLVFVHQVFTALESIQQELRYMADEVKALVQADADVNAAIVDEIDATNKLITAFEAISAQLAQVTDLSQVSAIAADMENKVALLKASTAAITAQLAPPPAPAV